MPTDTERRLEALENVLLYGGGVATGVASTIGLQSQLGRELAKRGAVAAPGVASRFVGRHPAATVIALGFTAHKLGLGPIETAELIAEEIAMPALETTPGTPQFYRKEIKRIKATKRKVSKANKAVKHAMGLLKAGSKRSTGADKGKLAKGSFKVATVAAGLANPLTPSNIGKGKGKVKSLARKLRKWW